MIHGIPVHNISNICYAKETENSHIIAVQHGKLVFLYKKIFLDQFLEIKNLFFLMIWCLLKANVNGLNRLS